MYRQPVEISTFSSPRKGGNGKGKKVSFSLKPGRAGKQKTTGKSATKAASPSSQGSEKAGLEGISDSGASVRVSVASSQRSSRSLSQRSDPEKGSVAEEVEDVIIEEERPYCPPTPNVTFILKQDATQIPVNIMCRKTIFLNYIRRVMGTDKDCLLDFCDLNGTLVGVRSLDSNDYVTTLFHPLNIYVACHLTTDVTILQQIEREAAAAATAKAEIEKAKKATARQAMKLADAESVDVETVPAKAVPANKHKIKSK